MIIIFNKCKYIAGRNTMSIKFKVLASIAALSIVLGACGKAEETANKPKVENKKEEKSKMNQKKSIMPMFLKKPLQS